jgi:hypothetical protein
MNYLDIVRWLLDHLWVEVVIVFFLAVSVYLAFQKHDVIELKPLRLPDP